MNKYQESLNALALCTTEVDDDYDVGVLQELVDKERKYRFHNLIKDKDDLPKSPGYYLAYANNGFYYCAYFRGKKWALDGHYRKVIAWKEIEKFEE